LPNARGTGTDISHEALAVAARNAQALGLDTRADFVASDYGTALRGSFDLVVSNPPYIASSDIAGLAREVRDHDPLGALDAGPDGLTAYRAIATDAPRVLVPGGHLVVEIGAGQQADVERLFVAAGLEIAATRHDLSGIPRAVAAKRPYQ
jgi:release factor glutamine methyltransferase